MYIGMGNMKKIITAFEYHGLDRFAYLYLSDGWMEVYDYIAGEDLPERIEKYGFAASSLQGALKEGYTVEYEIKRMEMVVLVKITIKERV
jgi:uncharacterized protein YjaZ